MVFDAGQLSLDRMSARQVQRVSRSRSSRRTCRALMTDYRRVARVPGEKKLVTGQRNRIGFVSPLMVIDTGRASRREEGSCPEFRAVPPPRQGTPSEYAGIYLRNQADAKWLQAFYILRQMWQHPLCVRKPDARGTDETRREETNVEESEREGWRGQKVV